MRNLDKMTRSDLLLTTHDAYDFLDKLRTNNEIKAGEIAQLISHMNQKIERVYEIVFSLEKLDTQDGVSKAFKEIGELLRKAWNHNGPLAHLAELKTFNFEVVGSSPARITKK